MLDSAVATRAHLQAGRKTEAATDAAAIPAGFVFNIPCVDDLANRTRLSNRLWQFTLDRGSMSVSADFRVDPRVLFKAPGEHNLTPQDASSGPFCIQFKYPAYATPIRTAAGLPPYAGATDDASVLTPIGSKTCYPLPLAERDNNPNF